VTVGYVEDKLNLVCRLACIKCPCVCIEYAVAADCLVDDNSTCAGNTLCIVVGITVRLAFSTAACDIFTAFCDEECIVVCYNSNIILAVAVHIGEYSLNFALCGVDELSLSFSCCELNEVASFEPLAEVSGRCFTALNPNYIAGTDCIVLVVCNAAFNLGYADLLVAVYLDFIGDTCVVGALSTECVSCALEYELIAVPRSYVLLSIVSCGKSSIVVCCAVAVSKTVEVVIKYCSTNENAVCIYNMIVYDRERLNGVAGNCEVQNGAFTNIVEEVEYFFVGYVNISGLAESFSYELLECLAGKLNCCACEVFAVKDLKLNILGCVEDLGVRSYNLAVNVIVALCPVLRPSGPCEGLCNLTVNSFAVTAGNPTLELLVTKRLSCKCLDNSLNLDGRKCCAELVAHVVTVVSYICAVCSECVEQVSCLTLCELVLGYESTNISNPSSIDCLATELSNSDVVVLPVSLVPLFVCSILCAVCTVVSLEELIIAHYTSNDSACFCE